MKRELIMKSEPLKGCKQFQPSLGGNYFSYEHVKSAVAGLIEFHEDRIEELIAEMVGLPFEVEEDFEFTTRINYFQIQTYLLMIQQEYDSIMAIEHWLEDAL